MRDIILIQLVTVTDLLLVFLTNKALHLRPDETLDKVRHLETLSLQKDVTDDVQTSPEDLTYIVKLEVDVSISQREKNFPEWIVIFFFL